MGLLKRILPPNLKRTDDASFTLEEWRVWFGGLLALIMVVVLPISFLVSYLHFIPQKQYGVLALISILWFLLLLRAMYPSRKALNNGVLWMAVVYILTIAFFVTLGPNYARSAWLVFAAVLAALYFGAWAGLIASVFNGLLLIALWLTMDPAHPAWAETYRMGLTNWLVFVAASSLLSMAASLPVGFLLGRLDSALRRVQAARDQLALEREELKQAHEALQKEMRERALSQMALKESEEKLTLLADNLPNAMVYQVLTMPDGQRRFTYVSKSVERLNEVSVEEVLKDAAALYSLVAPEFVDELQAKEEQALKTLSTFHHTIKTILPSGRIRWFDLAATPRRMSDGNVSWDGIQVDVTDRQEARLAHRESENLYRALVEHSHAGIVQTDDKFRLTHVNDEFCKIIGYERDELLGRDFREMLAEETAQKVVDYYQARQRGENPPSRYEILVKRKDGAERWVEISAANYVDSKGDGHAVAQLLEITERKEAEEALRESEALYRALVDDSHSGVILLDDDFCFTYVNEQFCRMLGCEREEVIGQDFRLFLAEETAHIPIGKYMEKLAGGSPEPRYEFMVKRSDGVKRWVEVSSSDITDVKGQTLFMGQLLDITERKEAEIALQESEKLYRALAENSHAGIALIDDSRRLTYVNDQICKISGYERHELTGMDFRKLLAEETAHIPAQQYQNRLKGGNAPTRYEYMLKRKDGSKCWVENSVTMFSNAQGEKFVLSQLLDVTERKKNEEAIRESESLFRAVVENSHDGIIIIDADYRLIYGNDEFFRIMGYDREEMIGQEFRQYLAEETAEVPTKHYEARRRGENPPSRYEFMVVRKDGEKRWVETSSAVIKNLKGETQVVGQLLDVTERKEAADALRESEQRFRALFNATFQFTGILSPDGRMLEANQTALDFIGMEMKDIEGVRFWESPWWQGDPEQQQRVKEAVRRAADGEFVRFEVENYGAGGRKINLDFNLKPIFGPDGKVVLLLPEGRDISDRIRAEDALKESEAKFRQVIQASPMGVYMYELEGPDRLVFKETNPAADRLMGPDHREMIGSTLEEVFPGLAGTDLPRRMKEIAAHGAEPIKNEIVDYEDGRQKGAWELHIFQTAPGKLAVLFQDISQRRLAEEEKARLESQLRQSQKMEAIGTLTGGIAHDFNNILGAILSTSEASLLKGNDFDSLRENMASIRDMSVRGRGLVHRLLAFSRQDEQATRSFDLAAVVTDSLDLVKTMSPAKVEIKTDLTPDLMVRADPTQIQQVILNLCSNAVQALGEKGGELKVLVAPKTISRGEANLRPGIRPGPHVLMQISDTGHGIPPKVLDRIFDPFFTTKPIGRGTGLGLSLAHGIVKAHNGAINAESREGQGTTMSVLLPLASLQAEERVEPAGDPTTGGKGEHVLVVDDEEIIVRSTAQTLEALGYRTSSFTSSLEAAAALERDPHGYDLILTDHIMPGLTGRQLAEKAAELRSGLPVILMTGMPDGIDEGRANGQVAKILTKPVTVKEVGQAVRQVLDQQDHS